MVVSKFPLSQPATCQTLRILWTNCKNYNGPIVAFKSKLTPAYCDAQILLIDQADALPDEATRASIHAQIHEELVDAGKGCTSKWQGLKIYVNGAYETREQRETQYNGAGWQHYELAANETWSSVEALMNAGNTYITNNLETLKGEDEDNMPDSFPDAFQAAFELFQSKWAAFTLSQQQGSLGAADKITKINKCYDEAILMNEVGQQVNAGNEEMQKLFSFEAVGALVERGGAASFEPTVMLNGVVKAGAEVHILNTDKRLVTGPDGKALFTQMREGDIQAEVICDGCADQTVSATITAGTRKRVTITLQPLFTGAMNVGSDPVSTPQPEMSSQPPNG
jgi:hypothetical protein